MHFRVCGFMAISIGIPVYNAEPYLADAIRSVFAQSYSDWELIIVDDGSTDRSLDIAMSIDDPRVRVISDGKNMRLPYRLNQIVRESRHEYVARMDADDLMSPYRLERQLDALRKNPDIDVVSTGVCSINNDGSPVGTRTHKQQLPLKNSDMYDGRSGVVHASVLAKKSWFLRNPYDENQVLTEDYELWLRAYLRNDFKVLVLDDPLYYYREEGNVVPQKMLRAYKSQRDVMKNLLGWDRDFFGVFFSILKFYGRSLVVYGLTTISGVDLLRSARNAEIMSTEKLNFFVLELEKIRKTRVSGLG